VSAAGQTDREQADYTSPATGGVHGVPFASGWWPHGSWARTAVRWTQASRRRSWIAAATVMTTSQAMVPARPVHGDSVLGAL
jgi:hypothetical protein